MCYIKDVGEVSPLPDTTGRRPFACRMKSKRRYVAGAERQEAYALRSDTAPR
jgi:hypothetical protein